MYDLLVRGGDVIDGTGTSRRSADVAISGDRIVAIGDLPGEASTVIDAAGKIVAPGFVDVHTHYDAQVFWDGALTPSPLHGVTTALAGNCGFTIAPLSTEDSDRAYLMSMLARVEGMPIDSLRAGVPWSWCSTADYLDAVECAGLGINAGFMVGHSALRRFVMGPDANQRAATDDETSRLAKLLHEGLDAGGLGFSSSWARTHNDAERCMVPSRHATREELVTLAGITGQHEGTSLEFIPMIGPTFQSWAMELMADMSAAAQRTLNWNVLQVTAATVGDAWSKLAASDLAARRGGKVVALTIPQTFELRLSFASGFVLDVISGWEDAMLLPLDEKLRLLRDPARRTELATLAADPDSPVRHLTDWAQQTIFDVRAPDNERFRGRTIAEIASSAKASPWQVLCDIVIRDELATSFGVRTDSGSDEDWKARVEIWRDHRTVIGASDAGAHLDMFGTFNYPTVLLNEAVRKRGLLTLEEAVHLLTDRPARLYGLIDRGTLREGWYADLVVLDPRTVGSDDLAMLFDLPSKAGRLFAGSRGIEHVVVNGGAIVRDGALTTERTGTLLRSGRDTRTPDLS